MENHDFYSQILSASIMIFDVLFQIMNFFILKDQFLSDLVRTINLYKVHCQWYKDFEYKDVECINEEGNKMLSSSLSPEENSFA